MKTILFSIIIAAFGLIWFLDPLKTTTTPMRMLKHPQEYVKSATTWEFSPEGALKSELNVSFWAYLPETDTSRLIKPHLTVYKPDHSIWHIDAKRGVLKQPTLGTIEDIELFEQVVLLQPSTPQNPYIKLETESLRYNPEKNYAETHDLITMTKPDMKVMGRGMQAFLDKNTVSLLHDVKTYFVSNDVKKTEKNEHPKDF